MNINEIKRLVNEGVSVCWKNKGYQVKNGTSGLYIIFTANGSMVGIHEPDYFDCEGNDLNGSFFVESD